jgi:hypothetical protein
MVSGGEATCAVVIGNLDANMNDGSLDSSEGSADRETKWRTSAADVPT